jgi:zinc/manganese transport system substrate-binding protein
MRASLATISFALLTSTALAAPVEVVASFSILGDMVKQVGGDRVAVTTIVGPNADSHVYEPRPQDAARLGNAQVFFVNGLGFEGWLERLVEATAFEGKVVTVSDGVVPHDAAESEGHDDHESHAGEDDEDHTAEDGHGHDEPGHEEAAHEDEGHDEAGHDDSAAGHDAHDHGSLDPHAWQSLGNGLIYVANIKAALCEIDAEGCATYTANAEAYSAQIAALDAEVKAAIAAVPEAQRKVITTHDAFGYFASAYGVTFLAPEGISTDSEASAADVARLIDQVKHDGVKALFIENMSDPRLVQQIAAETGAKLGGSLYSDALSEPGQGAATYLEMFRHNIGLLVPALEGK